MQGREAGCLAAFSALAGVGIGSSRVRAVENKPRGSEVFVLAKRLACSEVWLRTLTSCMGRTCRIALERGPDDVIYGFPDFEQLRRARG
jgi:hypothetical protein